MAGETLIGVAGYADGLSPRVQVQLSRDQGQLRLDVYGGSKAAHRTYRAGQEGASRAYIDRLHGASAREG